MGAARHFRWFSRLLRRGEAERELNEELQSHLDMETAANIRAGLPPDEARFAALRTFGGVAQVQDRCRDAWGVRFADRWQQDLGYAWRGLLRNPGYTATALATLVIGIAASTTIFSVVNAVMLKPLPFHQPDELVTVWSSLPRLGLNQLPTGYGNIADWRARSRTLSGLAAFDGTHAFVTIGDRAPRRTHAVMVSPNLLKVLGVRPILGTGFEGAGTADSTLRALISHAAWIEHYGASADVIGMPITVNGRPLTIGGVMPPGFYFPEKDVELWLPESFARAWDRMRLERGSETWRVVARLAEGRSLSEARTEMAGIASALEHEFPGANAGLGSSIVPLAAHLTGRSVRTGLLMLAGAVTAVLLIACSNVANLLLARGASRQREFAVREALGATRARVVWQLLAESALLAFIAAGLGALLTHFALRAVRGFGPASIPRLDEISLDAGALAFAAGAAILCTVIFGLAPALKSTRSSVTGMLRNADRGFSESGRSKRIRSGLIVAEFALAIALVTIAGLLVRSLARLNAVESGFQSDPVLLTGIVIEPGRNGADATEFLRQLLERVRTLPGVTAAGACEQVMLSNTEVRDREIVVEGGSVDAEAVARMPVRVDSAGPDFFRAVGIQLRRGREFSDADRADSPPVAIVNETVAHRLWPGADPIGRRFKTGGINSENPWLTVVGVVADVRRQGLDREPPPQFFMPFTQNPSQGAVIAVRTSVEPSTLAPAVRAAAREIDRTVLVSTGTTLRETLTGSLSTREFNLGLVGTFAAIALVLSGVGIFGVMSYSVACRTREVGIRMALGAAPGAIVRQLLGEGLGLAVRGILAGVAVAAVAIRGLTSLLFDVSPFDPVSFLGAMVLLTIVALLACLVPALRAIRIDPASALRAE